MLARRKGHSTSIILQPSQTRLWLRTFWNPLYTFYWVSEHWVATDQHTSFVMGTWISWNVRHQKSCSPCPALTLTLPVCWLIWISGALWSRDLIHILVLGCKRNGPCCGGRVCMSGLSTSLVPRLSIPACEWKTTFLYCKWWKSGWGLGTRRFLHCKLYSP